MRGRKDDGYWAVRQGRIRDKGEKGSMRMIIKFKTTSRRRAKEYRLISQQILLHMNETGAYTDSLIIPFRERLDALKEILKKDMESDKHPEPIVRLMMKKLDGVGEFFF